MNEKLNLFNGPITIESWYEDHEKCKCMTPFNQSPTSDYNTHQILCPLRAILKKRFFKKYAGFT